MKRLPDIFNTMQIFSITQLPLFSPDLIVQYCSFLNMIKTQTHTHHPAPAESYSDKTSDYGIHSADEAPCSSKATERNQEWRIKRELSVQAIHQLSTKCVSADCTAIFTENLIFSLRALYEKCEESRHNSLPDNCGDTCTSPLRHKSSFSSWWRTPSCHQTVW